MCKLCAHASSVLLAVRVSVPLLAHFPALLNLMFTSAPLCELICMTNRRKHSSPGVAKVKGGNEDAYEGKRGFCGISGIDHLFGLLFVVSPSLSHILWRDTKCIFKDIYDIYYIYVYVHIYTVFQVSSSTNSSLIAL